MLFVPVYNKNVSIEGLSNLAPCDGFFSFTPGILGEEKIDNGSSEAAVEAGGGGTVDDAHALRTYLATLVTGLAAVDATGHGTRRAGVHVIVAALLLRKSLLLLLSSNLLKPDLLLYTIIVCYYYYITHYLQVS